MNLIELVEGKIEIVDVTADEIMDYVYSMPRPTHKPMGDKYASKSLQDAQGEVFMPGTAQAIGRVKANSI